MAIEFDRTVEVHLRCDACPECGHAWPDGMIEHEHDCRYYPRSAEEEEALEALPGRADQWTS